MLPPLLRVLLDEPRLLVDYAAAYAALLTEDAVGWKTQRMRRLGFLLPVGVGVVLAVMFAGVALMLSAATGSGHWLLWAIPVLPLTVAIAAGWQASRAFPELLAFPRVRAQVRRDIQLFDRKEANDEPRT